MGQFDLQSFNFGWESPMGHISLETFQDISFGFNVDKNPKVNCPSADKQGK